MTESDTAAIAKSATTHSATTEAAMTEPVADDPASRPCVSLLPARYKRLETGHPWVYSNEVGMDAAARRCPPARSSPCGAPTASPLGVAMFNPHSLLAARLLDRDAGRAIGRRFLARRLERALRLRERLFDEPIIASSMPRPTDCPAWSSTASACPGRASQRRRHGALEPLVLEASSAVLEPAAIVLRNDSPARASKACRPNSIGCGDARQPAAGRAKTAPVPARSARRAEDRMVLRPARQSAVCRGLARGRGSSTSIATRGGFAVQAAARRGRRGRSASTARSRRWHSPPRPRC